ncbi:ABC transporter permease [Methanomassiliicoccus luminyensis]|uniref:ABC transporter permease n=1 Tax=Methanomassiliicoccus luminyensis TaxID=1080712 RepID=UPI00035D04A4|nr:ABC transporter permease [Methanomassiliicoccus luminyensis]
MSLALLIKDELNGFYRSKVMAILFVGLPAIAVLMYILSPDLGGMPLGAFTALLVSSTAGLLASTTLAVSIINERSQGAFDLFLVRPVKRSHLLLAKYLAVLTCVVLAAALALVLANGYDWYVSGTVDLGALRGPMLVTLTMACLCSAAAVLFGSLVRSVLVGVILTLYGGNQLSAVVVLPALENMFSLEATAALGIGLSIVILGLATTIFNRRLSS